MLKKLVPLKMVQMEPGADLEYQKHNKQDYRLSDLFQEIVFSPILDTNYLNDLLQNFEEHLQP